MHRAPHKPLLLLCVLDLYELGRIDANRIEATDELFELFDRYWSRLLPASHRGNPVLPFYHLAKEKEAFWHLIPQPGCETALVSGGQIRALSHLREIVAAARLDDELYNLLFADTARAQLHRALIETYFDQTVWLDLYEQKAINVEGTIYGDELLRRAHDPQPTQPPAPQQEAVRAQGFRRAIVTAYEHRCAFCGIRMRTVEGHTAVDAAHIIPWSVSKNDLPQNGMALCKLCHWTFDKGLLGVSLAYEIVASPQLTTNSNIPAFLTVVQGRLIFRPSDEKLWPAVDSLLWHRQNIFRKK